MHFQKANLFDVCLLLTLQRLKEPYLLLLLLVAVVVVVV